MEQLLAMRVSDYYQLDRTQPNLDFVDVDIVGDTRIFVDPRALRLLPSNWGNECVSLVQNFFQVVLSAIKEGNHNRARNLLLLLKEPNETHLGLSKKEARGRALGRDSAHDVWKNLSKSEAITSGLLEDLEDTILMVEGISSDIISDITTNIIREPLIQYTQNMADYYGISLVSNVNSGPLWDPLRQEWYSEFVELPVTKFGKLILVPKVIVRKKTDYEVEEYYRHYLLEHLREFELAANTELVHLLKNGRSRVTKKDLEAKYGRGKSTIVRETRNHPEILERYRKDKRRHYQPPLDHTEIAASQGSPLPEWDELIRTVKEIKPGKDFFDEYEKAIEKLLTTLFYPALTNPQKQFEIHDGRKRIDLTYTNVAREGFFYWLALHYSASNVFIECKNYTGDLGNPELDQLAGRFSPSRGQFGMIICRGFDNKDLFLKCCQDTAKDDRGFIIILDDDDLAKLVETRKQDFHINDFKLIWQEFYHLIS